MKIKTKLLLLSSVFLVALVAIVTAIVIVNIQKNAESDIERFRQESLTNAKAELRDKVTMVYDMIDTEYKAMTQKSVIESRYGKRVENVVETSMGLLNDLNRKVNNGEMTLFEAQTLAKAQISQMRYDDNVGYLWINDTAKPFPRMVMHPTVSSLNGAVLNDKKWNTALGDNQNLFVAAVSLTEKQGKGYIDYQWPKPTKDGKLTEMQPKISYVSLFEPWGWIVGSGIYVDDAEVDGINKIKEQIKNLRYDGGEGYFFVISDELPYTTMLLHPIIPALNGKLMNNPKWNKVALNKTKHLFTALVEVTRNKTNEGFVDYEWPKPTASGVTAENLPKLSFTKAFKPLNWIIGTGIYTDNIDTAVENKRQEIQNQVQELIKIIVGTALVILLLSLLASYWFANNLSNALAELTELTREISLGKGLDDEITSTSRSDEIGQLARAIERLQTSVKIMMKRMQR